MKNEAIILLSGGIDSTTLLAKLTQEGYKCTALSFDYGQNFLVELRYAKENAKKYGVTNHIVVKIDTSTFGQNPLIHQIGIESTLYNKENKKLYPKEFIPARNILFLSYALSLAGSQNITEIYIGANKDDHDFFPDCRQEFLTSFENAANHSSGYNEIGFPKIKINAPFINLKKAEILKLGKSLDIDYSKTVSCYYPVDEESCGQCMSCMIRKTAFAYNNFEDTISYSPISF